MKRPLVYGGEPMYEYVMRKLRENNGRRQWREISETTGMSMNTLIKIGKEVVLDPRISNVQTLADYFLNQDRESKKAQNKP